MIVLAVILSVLFVILLIRIFENRKPKPYEIVVAKYNEDISWLNGYQNVRVYDKLRGDLPNVGRESHTYLTYIVDNYYNLPEVVFFTQGCISEHYSLSPNYFINIKEDFSHNYNYLQSDYYFYSENLESYSKDHLYGYRNMKPTPTDKLGFRKWFNTYVDEEYDIDSYVTLWWGGIFSVRCECILSRPREYYVKLLNYIPKTNNPEVGHYFERSWFYIFNCHKKMS